MSQEKFEVVRSFFEAYLAGEPSSAEPFMDPQFESCPLGTPSCLHAAHGGKRVQPGLGGPDNQFERYEVVPQKIIDAGDDRVVVSLHRTAKSHGVQIEDRIAHVITVRGGRISRIASFLSLDRGPQAAGISE